jgi:hypothetical protein
MAEILGRGRSRVRDHNLRFSRRWNTVAADSFQRVAEEGMGIADTGHDWAMTSTATSQQWVVRNGVARLISATAGITHLASVFVGYSDMRVSARITIGATVTSFGVGLLFRVLGKSAGDWDGLFFSYAGGTTWHIGRIIDGGTPSLSSLASTLVGPSLSAGSTYRFEVEAIADAIEGFVDGTSVLSHTTAINQTNMRAGLLVRDHDDHLFDTFRVHRAA